MGSGRIFNNNSFFIIFCTLIIIHCSLPSEPIPVDNPVEAEFFWESPLPVLIRFSYNPDGCDDQRIVYPAGRRFVRSHEVRPLGVSERTRYSGRFEGVTEDGERLQSEEIEFSNSTASADSRLLEVITVYVGWGDAHLLILPNKEAVLIDCGGQKHIADLQSFLDERILSNGSSELRALVLTHPHEDHIGGAIGDPEVIGDGVLESFQVDALLLPEFDPVDFPLMEAIIRSAYASGTAVYYLQDGDDDIVRAQALAWDPGVRVRVLNSGSVYGSSNINNLSLVLKLSFHEIDFLFTGDAEKEVELKLLSRYSGSDMLASEVLKLSHHGSRDANSPIFLEAVSPRASILSIDSGEVGWNLPDEGVLASLEQLWVDLFRTDTRACDGSLMRSHISILTDGEYFEVHQLKR